MPIDECQNPNQPQKIILDSIPGDCGPVLPDSLKNVSAEMHTKTNQKVGYGQSGICDPMQTGQITEDLRKDPVRTADGSVIYRYSKAIRGADEALKDMFSDLVCIDEMGNTLPVPIIWGTQEKAVAAVLQSNVRQDSSLVVNRIKLPILSIYNSGIAFQQDRYIYHKAVDYFRNLRPDRKPGLTTRENRHERDTIFGVARGIPVDITYQLTAWTLYVEDMNQILEQVMLKFSPVAYIRVQGVHNWETIVKLDSIANNLETEPGDQQLRVIKFQFGMTAETFIPQPIVRKKAVLEEKIDIVDKVSDEEITEVISRLENLIEGLE
jgi:hypothetical protein